MVNVIAALKTLDRDLDNARAHYSRLTLETIINQVEGALLEIDTAVDGIADARACARRARVYLTGSKQ